MTLKAVAIANGHSSEVKSETYALITKQINYNAYAGAGAISYGKCGVVGIDGDYWNNIATGIYDAVALRDSGRYATSLTATSTLPSLGWYLEDEQGFTSITNPYTIFKAYHYTNDSGTVTLAGFTGAWATASYDMYIYDANNWFPTQITNYSVKRRQRLQMPE